MQALKTSKLPVDALLNRYERNGSYTDCYYIDLPRAISMEEYVTAFYTTPLFKIERSILSLMAGKPSTDSNAKELANGSATHFAAWSVEARESNQLLLRDFLGRTRSWLMVSPTESDGSKSTRLYFGSAVVPKSRPVAGKPSFGFLFHALYRFHHLYTKGLMLAVKSKLT